MRVIDCLLSFVLLAVCAVPMALIGLLIRLDSKGPVIYRQERLGRQRKPFQVWKFRTMKEHSEPEGPRLSYLGDPRVTRVGKVLRRYHIDELPQLWNVIRGDMALLGPRPERACYVERLTERVEGYENLFSVRPGLSSAGTVYFGYASSEEQMALRSQIDLKYLADKSATKYFRLIGATLITIVKGRGI